MKEQLNIKIYKNGSESFVLIRLVGNFNEGRKQVSARDLEGYFNCRNAMYPNTTNLIMMKADPGGYVISEDGGKTFTMWLEWAEVEELTEDEKEEIYWTEMNKKMG